MLGVDVSTRDRIRGEYGIDLANRLMSDNRDVAIDMHLSDYREGDKIIQPECVIDAITNLVILDASLGTILARRLLDHSKARVLDIDEMRCEKSVFDSVVARVVASKNLPRDIVDAEGSFTEIVQRLEHTVAKIHERS